MILCFYGKEGKFNDMFLHQQREVMQYIDPVMEIYPVIC